MGGEGGDTVSKFPRESYPTPLLQLSLIVPDCPQEDRNPRIAVGILLVLLIFCLTHTFYKFP